ncbi:hypothetical protein SAMN05444581_11349 [Methylocapsa palsarum]|uniref:Uncharacterized protein n=1 Tax=Methylocapsa palsarum TaxID=1612308 RepID=A0A1I4B5W1_9HYPH|nr:hypothetical protein SAMN05444581_11349 [Methylocapsa palsarum]
MEEASLKGTIISSGHMKLELYYNLQRQLLSLAFRPAVSVSRIRL